MEEDHFFWWWNFENETRTHYKGIDTKTISLPKEDIVNFFRFRILVCHNLFDDW